MTVFGALLVGPTLAQAASFDFVSASPRDASVGALAEFHGDAARAPFFKNGNQGYDFIIRHGDEPGLIDLRRNLDDSYDTGAVSSVGGVQTASVVGTGVFRISDGAGFELAANIQLNPTFSFGSMIGLNYNGVTTLPNASYGGS